jgi:hypothetical protein
MSVPLAADPPEAPSDLGPGFGLRCPLCRYDLRGLVEPRCPECGYAFEWAELREAARLHPYLFEHHPVRNRWSLARTLIGGWKPARFWATLRPTHEPQPRRLAIYALLVSLPTLLIPAAMLATITFQRSRLTWLGSVWNIFVAYRQPRQLILVTLELLLWPWLTLGTLMMLQASLRRARIRWVHLVRCAVYTCDVTCFCAVVILFGIALDAYQGGAGWLLHWGNFAAGNGRWVMFMLPVLVAVARRAGLAAIPADSACQAGRHPHTVHARHPVAEVHVRRERPELAAPVESTARRMLNPINWTGDRLLLLDQTRLPRETVYVEIADERQMHDAHPAAGRARRARDRRGGGVRGVPGDERCAVPGISRAARRSLRIPRDQQTDCSEPLLGDRPGEACRHDSSEIPRDAGEDR